MPDFPTVPDAATVDLDEMMAWLAKGLELAGGREIVYQSRLIGRVGASDVWIDGAPMSDHNLKDSIGGALMGGQRAIEDAVIASHRLKVYATTLRLTSDSTRSYELDTQTKLDSEWHNDEGAYLDDLSIFPRDGDDVPVWMRPVLARWGAWDPDRHCLTVDDKFRANGTPVDMPDVEVDYWLPFTETPEGPRRAHGYGAGNVGPGHTVATADELAAWRRANT